MELHTGERDAVFPIPVFIGISERFRAIQGMTERSIRQNTQAPVDIVHLYPEVESGCTGFSNVRYTIRYGIYLDCDMIVLGDIAELWGYRQSDRFVCMEDGSTEVAVIDCRHFCTNKREQYLLPKVCAIPPEWNVEDHKLGDREPVGAKLIHYTDLNKQPWVHGPHPNTHIEALWHQYVG